MSIYKKLAEKALQEAKNKKPLNESIVYPENMNETRNTKRMRYECARLNTPDKTRDAPPTADRGESQCAGRNV